MTFRSPLLFFLAVLFYIPTFSQSSNAESEKKLAPPARRAVQFSVFSNATQLPGSGILGILPFPLHPGVKLGTYWTYNDGKKNPLFQTANLGYFYHRNFEHAVQLYTELGYRYRTNIGLHPEVMLGGGYLHSFPDVEQFVLKDGQYVQKKLPMRAQAMAGITAGLNYQFRKEKVYTPAVFLQYQFWFQMPFVRQYVPILPNSALHLGIELPIIPHPHSGGGNKF